MKNILHVEDDMLIVHIYRPALEQAGFFVDVAVDGLMASQKLHKARPDLVVLDLLMPKLAGSDVIKFIRSTPALKTLPVIVLSDATIADQGTTAQKLGVERLLYKSQCNPSLLVAAIHELLGGRTDVAPAHP